jgi:hypothetical protein
MGLKIESGKKQKPIKAVVFGPEGCGKSTMGAAMPSPLMIDTEDGTGYIDCSRVSATNWADFSAATMELGRDQHGHKTIVFDTIDAAERMLADYVAEKHQKESIESFAYGKGWLMLAESFSKFLKACDQIAEHANVLLICHSTVKKFSPPDEADAYDRYEMRLSKHVLPLVKEWSDLIGFINWQDTIVTQQDGRKKATGGKKRLLHLERCAAWDAKSRLDLPACLPVDSAESLQPLLEQMES